MMKGIIATALLATVFVSVVSHAGPQRSQTEEAAQALGNSDPPAKTKRLKPTVKCSYEKVTGSNRRQRVCRTITQMASDEAQAREEIRELRRVMPEL